MERDRHHRPRDPLLFGSIRHTADVIAKRDCSIIPAGNKRSNCVFQQCGKDVSCTTDQRLTRVIFVTRISTTQVSDQRDFFLPHTWTRRTRRRLPCPHLANHDLRGWFLKDGPTLDGPAQHRTNSIAQTASHNLITPAGPGGAVAPDHKEEKS